MANNMNEEILQQQFEASEPKQAELVQQYCGDIEDRIWRATSNSHARYIADEACQKFDSECESDVVKTFLRQYIDRLVEKYWNIKR